MVYLPFLFPALSKAQGYISLRVTIILDMEDVRHCTGNGGQSRGVSTTMWLEERFADRQESVPAFLFKTFLMEDTPDEHFLTIHIIPYYGSR